MKKKFAFENSKPPFLELEGLELTDYPPELLVRSLI